MNKEKLLEALEQISKYYFDKNDYVSAGQINRAIDVVQDYDAEILETNNK